DRSTTQLEEMNESTSNCTLVDSNLKQKVFPILYCIAFIVSITLNSLAAWIFFNIKTKRSFTLFLKNLVLADLLMTLTFPFKILSDSELSPWQLTFFVCRYSSVVFYMSMYTSIIFLSLISLDRYLKIVKPFDNSKLHRVSYARKFAAGVWLIMVALVMPNIILTNQEATEKNAVNCTSLKSNLGQMWHVAVSYISITISIASLLILIFCYVSISKEIYNSNKRFKCSTENTRKPQQNILSVVAVFFICFVPYHLCRIPFTASQINLISSCTIKNILWQGKEATLFLSACNGCLDPIIYFYMCNSFNQLLSPNTCYAWAGKWN
uniref:G protein-coupled receptor 87 n=1 Tax=Callorhinchus milii TaxID=7868 RepID=A0A4W3I3I5_CALMI